MHLNTSLDVAAPGGAVLRTAPSRATITRLSIMVLLEFVVFGAWFATLGLVLATHNLAAQIGDAYFLSAVAAIISPLFVGAMGDGFMAPSRVFALAHLIGGCLMFALPYTVDHSMPTLMLVLVFVYMLAFQPTLGLVNSIALGALGGEQKFFPLIRVFGPLGWVLAGVSVGALGLSASTGVFVFAGIASLVLAAYAMTLPTAGFVRSKVRFSLGELVGVRAFVLFKRRNFRVLMAAALMTSVSLGVYNSFTSPYIAALGITNVAGVLALGQVSEVLFIVTIPFVLGRIGMKWALLAGMGMWGIRFLLFALATNADPWPAILGVALHGICNDFFIVIAAMYIDREAPAELAAQAQSWLILVISGFGQAFGSLASGAIFNHSVSQAMATQGSQAWTPMWLLPIGLAVATALLWVLGFRDEARSTSR